MRRSAFFKSFLVAVAITAFSLAELNAQAVNVALGGTASQTTSHPAGPPGNGIDGNLGNFTHTLPDDADPTWEVDLGQLYDIERVVAHNRDSCCGERLRDIVITILDDGGTAVYTSAILNEANGIPNPEFLEIDLVALEGGPITGQTVQVSRIPLEGDANGGVLSLGEVEVFAQLQEIAVLGAPQGAIVEVGSSYTFSVDASGPGELTYQWSVDGDDIPGATGASLELTDIQVEDEGAYSVLISNGGASPDVQTDPVDLIVPGLNMARFGVAVASSEGFGGVASRANDGNTNGVYPQGSVSHTNTGDAAPSWEVNLVGPSEINLISIWNRTDCCSNRLTNFKVTAFELDGDDNRVEIFSQVLLEDGSAPTTNPILVDPGETLLNVSVIRVERLGVEADFPGQFFLSLAEVQAFGSGPLPPPDPDLTKRPGAVATQSSTLGGFNAGLAIDGNLANFTHTQAAAELPDPSWWEVELGEADDISRIVIHNRGNCCGSRLRDIMVTIMDGDRNEVYVSDLLNPENDLGFDIHGNRQPLGPPSITLDLFALTGGNVNGKIVRITRIPDEDLSGSDGVGNDDEATVLSIGEVEVFEAVSCPEEGDTHCSGLTITPPEGGGPGLHLISVEGVDDSEDVISYTFTAENEEGTVITVGPQDLISEASMNLGLGTWTISVTTDDSPICEDVADDATCSDTYTVELGENVALGGTATQSSIGFGFPAEIAIDGNTANFTHTEANDVFPDPSWWQVDLDQGYDIASIIIHNRDNCCGSRMRDLTVFILDENGDVVFTSPLLNPENDLGFEVNGNRFPLGVELVTLDLVSEFGQTFFGHAVRIERTPDDDFSGSDGQGNDDEATVLSLGEVIVNQSERICPEEGDTHCSGLTITPPEEGGVGTYGVVADASDDSNDSIIYTFTAENEGGDSVTVGPQIGNPEASFELGEGSWTISVSVDDVTTCDDEADDATCSEVVVVETGAKFRRGDVDGNGRLEITDCVNNLSFQFLGTYDPPCFDACDFDDNGKIELTDPIGNLSHQFLGDPAPPAPGKDTCGVDPTEDHADVGGELGCETPPDNCDA